MTPPPLSAVESFEFRGRTFYVKRDDAIDPLLSGNKYRKLHTLLLTPGTHYRKLVSYGGTQSNAMLSIAALCHLKKWTFEYYTRPLSSHLREHSSGNLRAALGLGMQLVELPHEKYETCIAALGNDFDEFTLLVPQGGADPLAEAGIKALADEIEQWRRAQGIGHLRVVTPSGTGTTAYYLARHLPQLQIITTAVVGDAAYLRQQMRRLGALPANLRILQGPKKHHFAKPYAELYGLYRELCDAGVEVDLIYGAKMWYEMLDAIQEETPVLYVHSGGLIGNETMLERYRRKGLCDYCKE